MTQERHTKIAVIGAAGPRHESGEARVEWFPWNKLKNLENLADYDIVILDLLSMTDQTLQDRETFNSVLNERSMLEVLFSKGQERRNGAFFVLGDPRCSFTEMITPIPASASPLRSRNIEIPFLEWTGMKFRWDNRPGDTIERAWEASAGRFKPFADKLGRWQYSLAECRLASSVPNEFLPTDASANHGFELKVHVEDICSSRYGTSVVFSVKIAADFRAVYRNRPVTENQVVPMTGPIYFLPECQLTEEAMLEFVLRDLCGVERCSVGSLVQAPHEFVRVERAEEAEWPFWTPSTLRARRPSSPVAIRV